MTFKTFRSALQVIWDIWSFAYHTAGVKVVEPKHVVSSSERLSATGVQGVEPKRVVYSPEAAI